MDDDEEDRDFSKSIVYGFFDQAENTYKKIQKEMWVSYFMQAEFWVLVLY